jgi:hypothetical protein
MQYHAPDFKSFLVLKASPWYDVEQLIEEVIALRRINFSIVEQRQQALERLNSIIIHHPFAANLRFPDNKVYICELNSDWARKFQQLKSALSLKERDKEVLMKHNTSPTQHLDAPNTLGSDSQQAFWNATTNILDQLTRLDGCYDRASFERTFNMDWH